MRAAVLFDTHTEAGKTWCNRARQMFQTNFDVIKREAM